MRTKVIILILIWLGLRSVQAGVFDARYPSARAAAMGDALVAMPDEFWAAYTNPAALASLSGWQVGSAVQRPFNQTFLQNAFFSAALPLSSTYGNLALSFEFFGVKYQGATLSRENTLTLSHGFYLMNDIHSALSLGYNIRYYYWDLGESVEGRKLGAAGALGLDIGLQANLYHRVFAGVYVYNINAPTLGKNVPYDLPQRIVVGAAYRPITEVVTTISFDKTLGFDTQLQGGVEFWPVRWLALRVGATTNPNRFTAGLGLKIKGLKIDYSFQNHPVLPETHKIGIIYQFSN